MRRSEYRQDSDGQRLGRLDADRLYTRILAHRFDYVLAAVCGTRTRQFDLDGRRTILSQTIGAISKVIVEQQAQESVVTCTRHARANFDCEQNVETSFLRYRCG